LTWADSLKQLWTGNEREWRKNKKNFIRDGHSHRQIISVSTKSLTISITT